MYPRGMNTRPFGGMGRPQRPVRLPRGGFERYPPAFRAPVRGRGPAGAGLLGNPPGVFGASPRPRPRPFFIAQDQSKYFRPQSQESNQTSKTFKAPEFGKAKDVKEEANSKTVVGKEDEKIQEEAITKKEEAITKKEEEVQSEVEGTQGDSVEPPIQITETNGQTPSMVGGTTYQDTGGAMQEKPVVMVTEDQTGHAQKMGLVENYEDVGGAMQEEQVAMVTEGGEQEEEEEEEDTGFCKYCKMSFASDDAYWKHTRGLLHTQKLMELEGGHKDDPGNQDQENSTTGNNSGTSSYNQHGGYNEEENYEDYGGYEEGDEEYGGSGYEAGGYGKQGRGSYMAQNKFKPTKGGNTREEGYDFNTSNWMDIDKPEPKMPLDQRDFFPDDIGRTQFPDEFYCQICDIRCTGSVTFQMHTEGSKHKLKVEQYKMMGERGQIKIDTPQTVKPRVIDSNREAKLHGTIKKYDVPIIGLQFVTEFQKADPAGAVRYVCNLCESKCDGNTIVAHLTGHKHRVAYFKECRPDIHSLITIHHSSKKKSEVSAASEQFAKDVQDKDGMGKVKVKIEIDKATEKATSRLLKSGGMEFDSLLEKIQSSSDAGTEFSASQGPDNKRPKLKSSGYDSFDPEAAKNIGFSKTLGRKLPQPEYSDYGKTKTDHFQSMIDGPSHLYDNKFPDSSRKRPFSHIDRPSSDVMPVRGNPFRQGSSYAGQTDSQYGTADRHTDQPHLPDRERQTYRPVEPYQYRTTSRPPVSTPYSVTDRQSDRPPYSATDRQSITDRPPYSTTDRQSAIERPPYGTTDRQSITDRPPYGTTDRQRATERPPYGTTDRQSVTDRPPYGALQRPSVTERQSDRPPYGTMDRRTEVPPYGRPDHADTYTKNPVEVFDYGHSNKRTEEPPPNTEVQPHVQQGDKQGVEDEDTELFQQFLNWKRQQKAAMGANSSENTSTASVDPPREKPKPKPKEEDSAPNISDMLLNLSNSMINTEEEAAMALQVSNALTQALLQYRLKHVPKELLSSESPASKAKSPAQSSSTAVRQSKSQVPAAPTNNPSVRKSKSQVPAPPHAATTGQIKQVAQSISTVVSAMASTDSSAAGSLTSAPATNVTAYTYGAFNTGTLPATNVVPGVASSIPSVTQGSQVPSQTGVLPPGYQYNTASYMYQQSQAYYSTPYTAAQQTGVPTAATNLPTGSLTAYGVSTVQPPVPPPQMVPAPPRGQPKKPPPPPPLSQKY